MERDFSEYLKSIRFDRQLRNLKQKLEGKTVVIYGVGSLFMYAKENYDISFLNIIGVSDSRFYDEKSFEGYKVINKSDISVVNPDYVLVSTLEYTDIIDDLKFDYLKNTNIKILPMFKKSFFSIIKKIWF